MKAIHLLIATLIMMSLASCTAESSDPVDNSSSTYFLEKNVWRQKCYIRGKQFWQFKSKRFTCYQLKEADEILSNLANIPMRKKNIMYWLPIKAIRLYWKWLPARQSMVSTPLQFSFNLTGYSPTVTYITTDIMLNAVLHSWNGMWKDSVWPATTVKATSYSNRKAIFIWRWQTTESNICRFLSL